MDTVTGYYYQAGALPTPEELQQKVSDLQRAAHGMAHEIRELMNALNATVWDRDPDDLGTPDYAMDGVTDAAAYLQDTFKPCVDAAAVLADTLQDSRDSAERRCESLRQAELADYVAEQAEREAEDAEQRATRDAIYAEARALGMSQADTDTFVQMMECVEPSWLPSDTASRLPMFEHLRKAGASDGLLYAVLRHPPDDTSADTIDAVCDLLRDGDGSVPDELALSLLGIVLSDFDVSEIERLVSGALPLTDDPWDSLPTPSTLDLPIFGTSR